MGGQRWSKRNHWCGLRVLLAPRRVPVERFSKYSFRDTEIRLADSFKGVVEVKQIADGCQFQDPNSSGYDETSLLCDAPSLSVVREQKIRLEFQCQADGFGFAEHRQVEALDRCEMEL